MNDADGKLILETEIDTKEFDAQIKYVEQRMNEIEYQLKQADLGFDVGDTGKLEAEYERLGNQLINLKTRANKVKDGLQETNEEIREVGRASTEAGDKIDKSFSRGIKKLERFGLSLFSIRGIYSLVSKASSAYLSQNTELANKMQGVWIALGTMLSPIIETISNLMLKALGYLNVFVRALTGKDFVAIANKNTQALNKQAQAQERLNKSTAAFDEMNVLNSQSSGGSGGVSGGGTGQIEMPELNETLVKKLENLAKWLRENKELVEGIGIALLATFGAVKIAKIVSSIGNLIGSVAGGTGLAFLEYMLLGVAAALATKWAIDNWVNLIEVIDDVNESLKGNIDMQKQIAKIQEKTNDTYWEAVEAGKATVEVTEKYSDSLLEQNDRALDLIKTIQEEKSGIGELTGTNKLATEQQKEVIERIKTTTDNMIKLKDQNSLTAEQIVKFSSSLEKNIDYLDRCGINTDELKEKYEQLTGKKWDASVTATLNDKASDPFYKMLRQLQADGNVTLNVSSSGTIHGGGGRGFAVGGIVTQPTRAIIGEAGYPEAVVPMTQDYLSTLASLIGQYSGGGSNVTNVYLDGRLIQRQVSSKQSQSDFAANR